MHLRFRSGVTFMEVVIALAIILFVGAVIFPVFQKVKESSHQGVCQMNLKQLGLAYAQYEQESNDTLPPGLNAAGNGWAGELYPYIKYTSVYRCPYDPSHLPFISYAENQNIVKKNYGSFSKPTATVALYEFTTLNCDPSTSEANSTTGLSAPQDSKRHDGGTPETAYGLNFLTVDGHVKYLTPEKVSSGPGAVRAKALPQGTYMETFAIK